MSFGARLLSGPSAEITPAGTVLTGEERRNELSPMSPE